jgi:hypothetical protein
VGHSRAASLARFKWFLYLQDLCLLQRPYLGGKLLQGAGDDGQGGDELGVPVPLDNLAGDGSRSQPQLGAGFLLDLRLYGGVGAYGAGYLTDTYHSPGIG